MENLKQEALSFIERLQILYFEQRNVDALLPTMTEDTSWIGTGAQELCQNLEQAQTALTLEAQEFDGHFKIIKANFDASCISEKVCIVYGEITARPDNPAFADLYNRVTAVCVRKEDGIKLAHIHMSHPDADQENGRFYIRRDAAGRRETLLLRAERSTNELLDRNSQLEALTENIPGGVHQCECDEALTFLSMSHSFLSLVGYSQNEIEKRFHNRFAEMIHQDDLPRIQAEMEEQLSHGDTLDLEYRILRGDGKLLWILDQGKRTTLANGSQCFYCILMDITRQKEQREELRLTLERHKIIMDQTTDIIFEWNIAKDALTFSSNWYKKFGYDAIQDTISHKIPLSKNIHPDDMPAFIKIMKDSAAGTPYSETEFRIRDIFDCYKWHRIRATVQYDSQHHPIKAVGVILDIDSDKKQREHLQEKAQRDPLTNLYNKTAVRDMATRQISENSGESNQALLIIDIDNFKGVNDVYGHLCGDTLLCDMADVLKSHFRADDIVGRIGGDEFLVYLPKIAGEKEATKKIQALLMALRNLRPMRDAPPISCSIGVTLSLQKDADYLTLYKYADAALYQVKGQGKNNFAFYAPKNNESSSRLPVSAIGGIDSETCAVGDKLAQYAFKLLYSCIDVTTAVEHLLEIVGRAYDVSRVYIFENTPNGQMCNNTFEWCNTGVPTEIDKLQNVDYEKDLGGYLQNFDENYIFYCKDIHELHPDLYDILASQGICSVLQSAIMDDGTFMGYVGFDECRENRAWTKPQIASLTLIANILSTFLLKFRHKEEIRNSKEEKANG